MIDVLDLVAYLHDEGKITKFRAVAQENVMVTCPKQHFKIDPHTGEAVGHFEHRPSLGILLEEPYMFNCFGCGFRGTIEYYVAEVLEISPYEAVKWLSQRYDFDEDYHRKLNEKAVKKLREYEELKRKTEEMKTQPEVYFTPFKKIHRYTLDRGFTEETARKYEIGFDTRQRRIVLPVRNEQEKIIGLYGRAIDEDNEAKYLYYNYDDEGEIVGWDKGRVLLRNKTEERKDTVLVVESGLDVPWADQNGVTEIVDVVSILGSKMTREQAEMLSGYSEVILGLDNDYAGDVGTQKAEMLLTNRVKLSYIKYPTGIKDLGECTREQMIGLLENRVSIVNKRTEKLKRKIE